MRVMHVRRFVLRVEVQVGVRPSTVPVKVEVVPAAKAVAKGANSQPDEDARHQKLKRPFQPRGHPDAQGNNRAACHQNRQQVPKSPQCSGSYGLGGVGRRSLTQ
jgi:hypothetical protein